MSEKYSKKLIKHIKNEFISSIESPDTKCLKCGTEVAEGEYICDDCHSEITHIDNTNCLMCGRQSEKALCSYCKEIRKPYKKIYYCFPYRDFIRNEFVNFKENGNMLSGRFLTHAITQMYPSFDLPDIDIVTNVPAHFIRPILRLCDPPKQFAKSIGKTYDIKYQPLLSRKSNKHANRKSNRATRMKVAQNNFFAKDIDIRNKTILLVDDVITTGATTHICTNELKKMGAERVYILSLCCVLSE